MLYGPRWRRPHDVAHREAEEETLTETVKVGTDVVRAPATRRSETRLRAQRSPPPRGEAGPASTSRTDGTLARRLLFRAGHSKVRVTSNYAPDRGTREEDRVLFKPLVEANLVELEQVRFEEFWLAS